MGVTLCLKIRNNLKYENHKQAWNQVKCNEFGICLGEEEGSEGGNGGRSHEIYRTLCLCHQSQGPLLPSFSKKSQLCIYAAVLPTAES